MRPYSYYPEGSGGSSHIVERFIVFLVTGLLVGWGALRLSEYIPTFQRVYDYQNMVVFAGKIVNSQTGEWPNNRLVLVYLHNNEIGRYFTSTNEFPEINAEMQDGIFAIPVRNTYNLNANSFTVDKGSRANIGVYPLNGVYTWVELEEGQQIIFHVPSKNFTYVIKSVAGDASTLPPQLLSAKSTHLTETNEIVVTLPDDTLNAVGGLPAIVPENIPYFGGITSYSDTTTETRSINKFTVLLKNCGGSAILKQDYVDSRTIVREYHYEAGGQLGAEIPIPIPILWPKLVVALQAKYGFEDGQTKTQTVSYHMEAQPGTNQAYDINWNEIWKFGMMHTTFQGHMISIPYKVRTDLIYEVASRKMDCQ